MKLHRLELEGFGPFRHRQIVDFDAFDDDGIFLIAGRTGAGKSSILDGVCFALYGIVPRYEGAEKRLRSDYCAPEDPTEVVLEFSAGDHRYRVVRAPEYDRPKARGIGTTPQKARAELAVLDGGQWRGLSAKVGEVGAMLTDEIVGLSREQFLQVILLAQGRFAEFLLAKNDDRQALLRNLFGSRRYRDYEQILQTRRVQSQKTLDQRTGEVGFLLSDAEATIVEHSLGPSRDHGAAAADDESGGSVGAAAPTAVPASTAQRLAALDAAVHRAVARADQAAGARESAEAAHQAATTAHSARVSVRELQRKRTDARTSLDDLEKRSPVVASERERLEHALVAEALRATIEAADAAERAHQDAITAESAADDAWSTAGGSPGLAADALRVVDEQLTGELAVHSVTLQRERELSDLETRAAGLAERITHDEGMLAILDDLRAATALRLPKIDAELAPLQTAAARRELVEQRVQALTLRRAAAQDAARLAPTARAAAEQHQRATAVHAVAVGTVATLLQRRLDDAAGELASQLVDAAPCAVCGSIEHPNPAPLLHDRVTEADIQDAQDAATDAATRAAEAADAVRLVDTRLAEALARSEGMDADELTSDLATAERDVEATRSAAAARDTLVAERDGLRSADATAEVERAALAAALGSIKEEAAVLRDQVATIRLDVVTARGDFDSVAARIADATARRDLARQLAAARDARTARADMARDTAADLRRRVDATPFDDVDSVVDALLDSAARDALSAGIRAHEAELAGQRETLRVLELDLAGWPEELVDLTQTAAELAGATAARDAAATAAGTAEHIAERLRGLHERATAAHEMTAEIVARHERLAALTDAVAGRNPKKMDLETFVLAAELEEIVVAASRRLLEMSIGRYELRHSDALASHGGASGLGLAVVDSHTGKPRSPQSLSGGERFLASLALALGLAEVVTARAGGLRLDTLFIDEGFGSLDEDTLELAMRTLDELRQGGRTVGLISHVAAMKEQIPAQLAVVAAPQGPSVIRQEGAALSV